MKKWIKTKSIQLTNLWSLVKNGVILLVAGFFGLAVLGFLAKITWALWIAIFNLW